MPIIPIYLQARAQGTGPFTRLGLSGAPRPLYGSFGGKEAAAVPLTRLGLSGVPRHRYGDFSGKATAPDTARRPREHLKIIRMISSM